MKKDQDYVAKLEKAIEQKYGPQTISNPKCEWNAEKEREYIEQSLVEREKFSKFAQTQRKVEQDGFLINKKLLTKETNRTCPVCDVYSFRSRDDLYMNKFECCYSWYIQWVEGREERWQEGWRPKEEK